MGDLTKILPILVRPASSTCAWRPAKCGRPTWIAAFDSKRNWRTKPSTAIMLKWRNPFREATAGYQPAHPSWVLTMPEHPSLYDSQHICNQLETIMFWVLVRSQKRHVSENTTDMLHKCLATHRAQTSWSTTRRMFCKNPKEFSPMAEKVHRCLKILQTAALSREYLYLPPENCGSSSEEWVVLK